MRRKNALITLPIALLATWLVCPPAVQAASGWIFYWDGSYHGKVIDAETKEPIEGAVVVALHTVSCYRIVQQNAKAVGVQEALTQANGEFHIPPYWTVTTPECWASFTSFTVFKPWYHTFPVSTAFIGKEPQPRVYPSSENPRLKRMEDIFRVGAVIELPPLKTDEDLRKTNVFFALDIGRFKHTLPHLKRLEEELMVLKYPSDPRFAR